MKPRNLIVWAGLTFACLTASSCWTQLSTPTWIIDLTQEKVKLTPDEFQRLVYSSQVLTVFDAKPELEGSLLALLELQRQKNPVESTSSPVTPVRWALAEYRKEASSHTLPVTWRDEVLGRYFLTLCEAPGLAERPTVALNLLKVLLAQQDAPSFLGEQAGRFHAAGQYGAQFLAQSKFIPGMQVVGVADLNSEKARSACISV